MEIKIEQKKENALKEIVKFTLIALAIVIPIRTYVAQPFIVKGASMDPTFASGQYLIVDQLTYHFEKPKREDVIIFRYPANPEIFYIKRIIGLPGEKVEMRNGEIFISDSSSSTPVKISDSYISDSRRTYETFTVNLRENEYFVMGDNRRESLDSRVWGPLEEKYIVGRPLVRLVPVSKISVFPGK